MFETQGGTWNRTQNLPKKGSACISSSDHWTKSCCGNSTHGARTTGSPGKAIAVEATVKPAQLHGRGVRTSETRVPDRGSPVRLSFFCIALQDTRPAFLFSREAA